MNMHVRSIKTAIWVLISMFMLSAGLSAKGDILVSLRFYKGLKNGDTQETGIITTYHLRPLFVGNMISASTLAHEKEELKRVFNLDSLKLVTQTQWGWQETQKDKRFQVIILNGHEFQVQLELTKNPDGFRTQVIEKAKKGDKTLLDTDISLPEEKTAVFGFEDSMKKPYFLSFYREKNETVIREEPLTLMENERPKLIKRIKPEYPKTAKMAQISGDVVLQVTLSISGHIRNIKALRGHPMLTKAAIEAVRGWEYEPYFSGGKERTAVFTVKINYNLPGQKKNKENNSKANSDNGPITNGMIWPCKGYLTSEYGWRQHPITKSRAFHKGIDIATKKGKPVAAAADGEVISAKYEGVYGNLIVVKHKDGYTTKYAQLSGFAVKAGEKVKQGELIGYVGSSGRSTAPHLHWEVHKDGKPINPMIMIDN